MKMYAAAFVSLVGIASVFVEISKIKINPWRRLLEFAGRCLNREIKKELDGINGVLKAHGEYLRDIEIAMDINEIKRIRAEIFAFADSCKMGEKHTEEAFLHIIDIHEDYEELIRKYDMTNGRINVDYDYIMDVYRKCVKNGVM